MTPARRCCAAIAREWLAFPALAKMRDHVGLVERAHRLERHQFGIARPDADAEELPLRFAAHSPALARALTAAAVMALPPMRPRTIRNGTPRGSAASASLDSAAPTKPTGMPRIAAGFGAPASSISSRRNNAVGALPMATTAPPSRSRHSSSAAAERVVPSFSRERGDARIVERADHLVARRQPRAGDAVRHHLGIAQDRRAGGERAARRRDQIWSEHDVPRRLDDAAGVDHAHDDIGFLRGEARQIRLGADDGEGLFVDRRAVAQVGRAFRHDAPPAWRSQSLPIADSRQRPRTACPASSRWRRARSRSGVPTMVKAAGAGMRAALGAAGNVDAFHHRPAMTRRLRRSPARSARAGI